MIDMDRLISFCAANKDAEGRELTGHNLGCLVVDYWVDGATVIIVVPGWQSADWLGAHALGMELHPMAERIIITDVNGDATIQTKDAAGEWTTHGSLALRTAIGAVS